ncbi:MAG: hypothetical protein KGD57_03825 [Candidatus Lokiarchaeota archaeon]|nr:hypothetical protein [Candidatus Lokiarchaeota archaeon]
MSDIKKGNKRLKVDIFIPLHICSCQWVDFMNRVFKVLRPYMRNIVHETKSLNSKEAAEKNLFQNCVVINREKIITSIYELERELPKLLSEIGVSVS